MRFIPFLAATLLALPALAAPWKIDPKSTLTFTVKQAGTPFTGQFTKFTPVVEFDPAHPEAGNISVTVDMASATIDDKDKRESLPTEDWFFTEKFPKATFISTRIEHVGFDSNTYMAQGNLTLRGVTKPVMLSFALEEHHDHTRAFGNASINRQDFGIGQGQWKSDEWIAYPVEVKFNLIATKP